MSSQPFTQQCARHEVSRALPSSSFPTRPGSLTLIDSRSECLVTAENHACRQAGKKLTDRCLCPIDMLPDDVLLEIFDFFAKEYPLFIKDTQAWQSLVHVCRRWRCVVFGSPRRLDLPLLCKAKTPVRDTLDVWPPLPLVIHDRPSSSDSLDDIIALLRVEHRDRNRVCQISLWDLNSSQLEEISAAIQDSFPELTYLSLHSREETVPLLPDSFLDGTSPRLEYLELACIPFPGLCKLHLAAPHLVDLHLLKIPHSGYFSPEAMLTVLSALTNLQYLWLGFESPQSRPDWASRRPPKRSLLPVLTYFSFNGVSEYLDNLVERVDAPRLNDLDITFFNQIVFDTPRLVQFISRTPMLKFEKARVVFWDRAARVKISSQTPNYGELEVEILCRESDWQVSSLEQVCTSCLPPLSTLKDLYIDENSFSPPDWKDSIENTLWLDLLQPFTPVKNLYLSENIAPRIAPALKELVEGRTTEMLPALQNIFLEGFQPTGPVQEGIIQFVAVRQVTSHPIAVTCWERKWNVDENDYV